MSPSTAVSHILLARQSLGFTFHIVLTLSLSGALTLIALAYSVLLAFKLLTQSGGDTVANVLLATVCFSVAAWTGTSIARDIGVYVTNPHLIYIVTPMFYLLGPALYLYTKRITTGEQPFGSSRSWMHLIPFALFIVAATPFYIMDAADKLRVFQGTQSPSWLLGVMLLTIVPSMLIYSLLCLRPIKRYEARAKDHFSDLEHGNLRWLKRLCIGMLTLVLLDALLSRLLAMTPWVVDSISPSVVMRISLLFFIVFVAFSALGQPAFMYRETAAAEERPPEEVEDVQQEKYARSGLRDDSAKYYVSKLETLMREQKAFLDSELTLRSLAVMLKLRPHLLSQTLNEQVGKPFYDYINEQRVAYAKQMLSDEANAKMSVLDIAFASGYRNKVSFYSAFKRFVGVTPTEYRNQDTSLATKSTSRGSAELQG